MSVYLRAVVRDRPEHQGQVQRVRPRGPRFVEHPVAADALDAHARRAPGPEPPRNPLASPEATGHQLGRDHFTETEERSGRPADGQLTAQVLVQARPGRQAAIGKLTNPRTVAQPTALVSRVSGCRRPGSCTRKPRSSLRRPGLRRPGCSDRSRPVPHGKLPARGNCVRGRSQSQRRSAISAPSATASLTKFGTVGAARYR
jgi:hypothetical protein